MVFIYILFHKIRNSWLIEFTTAETLMPPAKLFLECLI